MARCRQRTFSARETTFPRLRPTRTSSAPNSTARARACALPSPISSAMARSGRRRTSNRSRAARLFQRSKPQGKRPGIAPGPWPFLDVASLSLFGRFRTRERRILLAVERQLRVALGGELLVAAQLAAGARRDEPADDDVFLEAFE